MAKLASTGSFTSAPWRVTLRDRVPLLCAAAFAIVWLVCAVAPWSRRTWLLENVITFAVVPLLVASYRRFRFSDRAYVQGTLFLILHTIGSHYEYSAVPLGAWLSDALELGRNHYDRVVHFASGLLLLTGCRELLFHRPPRLGAARELAHAFTLLAFGALLYELLEWGTAVVVEPASGTAFLGTQGDPWDAQKDMALACAGAAIAAGVEFARSARHRAKAGVPNKERQP